jgi:hypothetical protein
VKGRKKGSEVWNRFSDPFIMALSVILIQGMGIIGDECPIIYQCVLV